MPRAPQRIDSARPIDFVRPLVITDDPELLDDVLRVAAAAGVEPLVASSAVAARAWWSAAPLVVVGRDVAGDVARARFAPRPSVLLATLGPPGATPDDAELWGLAHRVGADDVISLPEAEQWLVAAFAGGGDGEAPDAAMVAVVGGRGGAGASTLAAALALTAVRRGRATLAIDLDPLGGGLDVLFGAEDVPGMRWSQLTAARGRIAPALLSGALPRVDGIALLGCDPQAADGIPAEAAASVLDAAARDFDVIVTDLPRRPDAAAREVLARADLTLLLVPADLRATSAAARVAARIGPHVRDLRLIVRGPALGGLTAEMVAGALALPLVGDVRPEPGCAARLERGDPPGRGGRGPLGACCDVLLDELELACARRAA